MLLLLMTIDKEECQTVNTKNMTIIITKLAVTYRSRLRPRTWILALRTKAKD